MIRTKAVALGSLMGVALAFGPVSSASADDGTHNRWGHGGSWGHSGNWNQGSGNWNHGGWGHSNGNWGHGWSGCCSRR